MKDVLALINDGLQNLYMRVFKIDLNAVPQRCLVIGGHPCAKDDSVDCSWWH